MASGATHTADIAAAEADHRAGRPADAARRCVAILQARPRDPPALHLLGLLAHQAGDDAGAAVLIRDAIAAAPRSADFHANLGVVLLRLRRPAEAAAALKTALRLRPGLFAAQSNLGVAHFALGAFDAAAKAAGAALRIRPADPATLCNRALALQASGQLAAALADLDAAVQADPLSYAAQLARGSLLLSMGRPQPAIDALDRATALGAGDLRASQARIVAMNYLPGATTAQIGAEARRLAPLETAPRPPRTDPAPDRPLRIGYVSADFRDHPVGYFLLGAVAARDRARTEVFCYDNAADQDAMTAQLQAATDHWRPIAGLDDAAAAELIRSDGIDILIDLAGHTQGNRLGVFARRAAPLQAAWLGYFGTTGCTAIDAVIADRHVLPVGDEAAYAERVVRLPGSYLCFTPPAAAGPVAPLPAGLDGPFTFGCFNNRAKLGPGVLALWARVLLAVPLSRLLLKSSQYADKAIRREIVQALETDGIDPARVLFEGNSPLPAMFEAYGRVDVALDPFPFAGGATTAQALWMGVPVITLAGRTWPGRQGVSLLSAAGFPDWIAGDEAAYVAVAGRLAADRPALALLRGTLRQRVAASDLCDGQTFAGQLDAVYRALWRTHATLGVPG